MKKILSLLICTFLITLFAIPCYAIASAPEVNISIPSSPIDNLSVGEKFVAYVTVRSDNLKSFNITPKDISGHCNAINFTEIKKIDEKTIRITGDCVATLAGSFVIAEGVAVNNDGVISSETFSNIFIDNGETPMNNSWGYIEGYNTYLIIFLIILFIIILIVILVLLIPYIAKSKPQNIQD